MPITYIEGDILKSNADFLVSPVNCAGRSGAGLALKFQEKFPSQEKEFQDEARRGRIKAGSVFVACFANCDFTPRTDGSDVPLERYIVYFPTKIQPRCKSEIRDVYEGLIALKQVLVTELLIRNKISCAIPALGCGLGELPWDRVRAAIEYTFKDWLYQLDIRVYEPH